MRRPHSLWLLGALALALAWPSRAAAYSDSMSFQRDPSSDTAGGGGGLYFTGSPRQHGLDCAACHIEPTQATALRISTLLQDGQNAQLLERGYVPGQVYEIEVAFDGELLGPETPCDPQGAEVCDLNLFALELLDENGVPKGALCPTQPKAGEPFHCELCGNKRARGTATALDCSVIVADGFDQNAARWRNGVTAYSFFWTAPTDDVGPLMLYVSAVDGRGRETPDGEVTSYRHDGVATVHIPISSPSQTWPEPSSCRAVARGDVSWSLLLGWAMVVAWRRRPGKRAPTAA